MSIRLALAVAAVGLAAASGCGVSPTYRDSTGGYVGAYISAKRQWSAGGSVSSPGAAIDDNLGTAARAAAASAELNINLGSTCLFQTVVLDHGGDELGFAGKIRLATSLDGQSYTTRYTAPGTRRVTILCLPQPVLARYLRLIVLAPGPRTWNVAEVYLQ